MRTARKVQTRKYQEQHLLPTLVCMIPRSASSWRLSPKSIILIGESSSGERKRKFSGFKSLNDKKVSCGYAAGQRANKQKQTHLCTILRDTRTRSQRAHKTMSDPTFHNPRSNRQKDSPFLFVTISYGIQNIADKRRGIVFRKMTFRRLSFGNDSIK